MLCLDDIRIFLKVVEQGSLSKAAVLLNIPKSKVSRRITALEEQTGFLLIDRDHVPIKITPSGKQVYEWYVGLFHQLELAENKVLQRKCQPQGVLRISMPYNLANTGFMQGINQFCQRYPRLQVDCQISNVSCDFSDESFEVGFFINIHALPDGHYIARPYREIASGIFAAPQFLAQYPALKTIEQLKDVPCMTSQAVKSFVFMGQPVDEEKQSIEVSGPLIINSLPAHILAAENGLGLIRAPIFSCEESVKQGRLVQVHLDYASAPYQIFIVYKKPQLLSANAKLFIDFFMQ